MIETELGLTVLFYSLFAATLATFLYILFSTLVRRQPSDPFLKFSCACLLLLHLPSLFFLTVTRHLLWIHAFELIQNVLASFSVFVFTDYYSDLMTTEIETQARLDTDTSKFIFVRWVLSLLELGLQIFSASASFCQDSESFVCYRFGHLYSIWALLLVCKLYPCLLLGDALIIVLVELEDDVAHLKWQCGYMLGMVLLVPMSKALLLLLLRSVSAPLLSCILAIELLVLAWLFVFAFQITIRLRLADAIDNDRPRHRHRHREPSLSPLLESLAMPHAHVDASSPHLDVAPASASTSSTSISRPSAMHGPARQRALLPASEWSTYYHLPDMRRVLFFCRSWMATYYQSLHIKMSRLMRSFRPPFDMSPNDDLADEAVSVSSSLLQSYHSDSTEPLSSKAQADPTDDFEVLSISSLL